MDFAVGITTYNRPKIMIKRLLGYIKLTADSGIILWINSRAIMRYEEYQNEFLEYTHTRLWYLDGRTENIRESVKDIRKKIAEL